jgi:hypothetical protein
MEVKVRLRAITIKDEDSGEEFTVQTLRTAEDIAAYVEETEKDEIVSKLEEAVIEAYHK